MATDHSIRAKRERAQLAAIALLNAAGGVFFMTTGKISAAVVLLGLSLIGVVRLMRLEKAARRDDGAVGK